MAMSQFIMIGDKIINTQFIKDMTFIEHKESRSIRLSLVGEDDPVMYQNFTDKKAYDDSKQRLIRELSVLIL